MQPDISSVTRLILELLAESSPEFGARLKQRLNSALLKQGHEYFNERSLGFAGFRDFLQKSLAGKVSVERPAGAGDIIVRLAKNSSPAPVPPAVTQILPVIRSDVWQAFIQPDLARKRYLKKLTGQLLHFLEGSDTAIEREVLESKQEFAEIIPVKPELQLQWMEEYLASASVSHSEREALQPLLGGAYSSTLNAAFTRALGEKGAAWRAYRTKLIHSKIDGWCRKYGVPIERLAAAQKSEPLPGSSSAAPTTDSPRAQAIRLLETLSDDDISRIVLPMLATTMFVKARMAN